MIKWKLVGNMRCTILQKVCHYVSRKVENSFPARTVWLPSRHSVPVYSHFAPCRADHEAGSTSRSRDHRHNSEHGLQTNPPVRLRRRRQHLFPLRQERRQQRSFHAHFRQAGGREVHLGAYGPAQGRGNARHGDARSFRGRQEVRSGCQVRGRPGARSPTANNSEQSASSRART